MPIDFHYDPDVGILLTRAEGLLTYDEILRHLNEERNAKRIAHPEIFDATQASTNSTAEQVRVVVQRMIEPRSSYQSQFLPPAPLEPCHECQDRNNRDCAEDAGAQTSDDCETFWRTRTLHAYALRVHLRALLISSPPNGFLSRSIFGRPLQDALPSGVLLFRGVSPGRRMSDR
jgi:hypothetical protein